MTPLRGSTEVTRQGGFLGLVYVALTALAWAMGAETHDGLPGADLVEFAAAIAGLSFYAGAFSRLRGYRVRWWALAACALGFVLLIVGGGVYDNPVPGALLFGGGVLAIWVALAVAGVAPPGVLVLVVLAVAAYAAGLDAANEVLQLLATGWLGYALWREPQDESERATVALGER